MNNNNLNIFERLLAITNELGKVEKSLNVSTGKGGSYKALSEGDVLAAVKPLEAEFGVFSYPVNREVVDSQVLPSDGQKKTYFLRIKTTYRFVNVNNPAEFIDICSFGDGIDTGDKGCGKAITYSDKYALMKLYKIETGEDPDQFASPQDSNNNIASEFAAGYDLASEKQLNILKQYYTGANLTKLLKCNNISAIEELPKKKATELIKSIYENVSLP